MIKYLGVTLKGILMGAADVVPGVSGGTIAFITGIYEELIDSINKVDGQALHLFSKFKIKDLWAHVNGNFLAALFIGIGISLVSLAKVITYQIENNPIPTWAFFFGLIVASALYIGRQIDKWSWREGLALTLGVIVAYAITIAPAMSESGQLWFIFLSGCIAICAMILPGISGSFILLLLGSYQTVMSALSNLTDDFKTHIWTIGVFMLGCLTGILTFSRLVSWAFKNARSITMATLTGFMLGSLNKVWPWKEVIEYRVNSHEEVVPFIEKSVFPSEFQTLTLQDPQTLYAVIFAIIGFALVLILGTFDRKKDLAS